MKQKNGADNGRIFSFGDPHEGFVIIEWLHDSIENPSHSIGDIFKEAANGHAQIERFDVIDLRLDPPSINGRRYSGSRETLVKEAAVYGVLLAVNRYYYIFAQNSVGARGGLKERG